MFSPGQLVSVSDGALKAFLIAWQPDGQALVRSRATGRLFQVPAEALAALKEAPRESTPLKKAPVEELPDKACPRCEGNGRVLATSGRWILCPACRGSGRIDYTGWRAL